MNNRDDQLQMVKDCEARESKLSDWERGFIDSISNQLDSGRTLSVAQDDRLEAIWNAVT